MADQPMSGNVVLITGAARNLGKELSHTFAQAGAAVAVNTRSNMDQAERVAQTIRNRGGEAIAVWADVKKVEEVEHMVKTVETSLGPVTILVNNATCRYRAPFDLLKTLVAKLRLKSRSSAGLRGFSSFVFRLRRSLKSTTFGHTGA